MSRDDRATRRRRTRAQAHPQAEALEGRELLTAHLGPAAPPFAFKLPDYPVFSQQGGAAQITVVRKDARGEAQAVVSTDIDGASAGTATAGVQYQPVHETLDFRPGVSSQVVSIPLIAGAPNPGVISLPVFVTGTAPDSPYSAAALPIVARADVSRPRVTGAALVVRGHDVAAIRLGFNKPMDPTSVIQDLSNYRIQVTRGNMFQNLFGFIGNAFLGPAASGSQYVQSGAIYLASAKYDPVANVATLYLSGKVRTSNKFQSAGVYLRPHGSANPPTDLGGDPLQSFNLSLDRHSVIPGLHPARASASTPPAPSVKARSRPSGPGA